MNWSIWHREATASAAVMALVAVALLMAGCEKTPDTITGTSGDNSSATGLAKASNGMIGIEVVLNTAITDAIVKDLGTYGDVLDKIYELNALRLRAMAGNLSKIQALPYVAAASPDAERLGSPVDVVAATDFSSGRNTWNLDAVNVTNYGVLGRTVAYDATGVYIGVLDTGLLDSWRQYFPQERIAMEYATSFSGGGVAGLVVAEQPNKWEHDQDSHGTHVTSTIIGYNFYGTSINGVAPMAKIIPVKVLNQNGMGWSSVIAEGILYIAKLKETVLAGFPVVINMSLGGSHPSALEKAAIDYAIEKGVIVVAAAGNEGDAGMHYPGAFSNVISVAASGWVGEWAQSSWWLRNVADPTNPDDFYITDFSGRQKTDQDLDVAAPGSWVVGPYQMNSGKTSYYYLGGTSMATPHVAGIVALMAQKNPALTASQAEDILESTAIPLPAGSRTVKNPDGSISIYTWGSDATGAGLVTADAALAGM